MSLFATIRSGVRRALAPLARPILRRLRPRLSRIADLFRLSAAWHQYAPALANAAASVGAVSREQARMKREYDAAIAELRAAVAALKEPGAPAVPGMRLNLGPMPRPGYTNVFTQPAPGIDIVCAFDSLPFGAGEISEIHVQGLDALRAGDVQRLLAHWMELLKPGGTLRASK